MPIYEYQCIDDNQNCEHCREPFEVVQSIFDPSLENCEKCKAPIRRNIGAVGFKMGKKYLLRDSNLKKKGFTKLVNEGDGKFRKI